MRETDVAKFMMLSTIYLACPRNEAEFEDSAEIEDSAKIASTTHAKPGRARIKASRSVGWAADEDDRHVRRQLYARPD